LKLTVLGWTSGISGPTSPQAGYMLQTDETTLLFECGAGVVAELQKQFEMTDFEAMLISHLHADHIVDVMELVVHRRYNPIWDEPGYERRLPTWAPAEAPERLAYAYAPTAAARETESLTDVFDFRTIEDGTKLTVGDIEVEVIAVQHSIECYGFRFTAGGRTLGFSSDTGPCDGVMKIARDADIFLCEATWNQSREASSHLSGREAGRIAKEAGAKRMLLTHIESWVDQDEIIGEARGAYGGEMERVEAGRAYEV
jgi:ribonuclease BN (tRNA processing enzyme)